MEKEITSSKDKWNIYHTRKYPTENGWRWRRYKCKLCEKQGKNKIISFNNLNPHMVASHPEEWKSSDNIDQFFEQIRE
jgi:hypothetical protein